MQRVWATVASVWAMLVIVAVLAWIRQPVAVPAPQAAPTALIVKGKNGASHLVLVGASSTATAHAVTQTSPPPTG